jgi:hypothetical protein
VQTGTHAGRDVRAVSTLLRAEAPTSRRQLLPNVRLAIWAGQGRDAAAPAAHVQHPLFPEILIASSVLAEGVDLHLHCRHVITTI